MCPLKSHLYHTAPLKSKVKTILIIRIKKLQVGAFCSEKMTMMIMLTMTIISVEETFVTKQQLLLRHPFRITGDPCILICSQQCDLFPNCTIFALNRTISLANKNGELLTKQPIRFQGLFKVSNQIARKCKTKETMIK